MARVKKVPAKKVAAPRKRVAKAKPATPAPASSASPDKNRRSSWRMTEADFNRLRYSVLPHERTTWQGMLDEAVGAWLKARGHDPLEG